MKVPALRITYWAYAKPVGVEDLIDVDRFKDEISQNYSSLIKVYPSDRGGEVFQLIIEFFANLTLKDYLTAIGGYIGGMAIDKVAEPILDSYLFNPLKKAYQRLKQKNPDLDVYSLTFDLSDTKITIYYLNNNSVLDNLDLILKEVADRYKNLWYLQDFPTEIHIPAIKDETDGNVYYRPPFEMDESIDLKSIVYNEGYWGLKIFKYGIECVYSLTDNKIIPEQAFYTEDDLYSRGILKR